MSDFIPYEPTVGKHSADQCDHANATFTNVGEGWDVRMCPDCTDWPKLCRNSIIVTPSTYELAKVIRGIVNLLGGEVPNGT